MIYLYGNVSLLCVRYYLSDFVKTWADKGIDKIKIYS